MFIPNTLAKSPFLQHVGKTLPSPLTSSPRALSPSSQHKDPVGDSKELHSFGVHIQGLGQEEQAVWEALVLGNEK